jgi:hypothetical protein
VERYPRRPARHEQARFSLVAIGQHHGAYDLAIFPPFESNEPHALARCDRIDDKPFDTAIGDRNERRIGSPCDADPAKAAQPGGNA